MYRTNSLMKYHSLLKMKKKYVFFLHKYSFANTEAQSRISKNSQKLSLITFGQGAPPIIGSFRTPHTPSFPIRHSPSSPTPPLLDHVKVDNGHHHHPCSHPHPQPHPCILKIYIFSEFFTRSPGHQVTRDAIYAIFTCWIIPTSPDVYVLSSS